MNQSKDKTRSGRYSGKRDLLILSDAKFQLQKPQAHLELKWPRVEVNEVSEWTWKLGENEKVNEQKFKAISEILNGRKQPTIYFRMECLDHPQPAEFLIIEIFQK